MCRDGLAHLTVVDDTERDSELHAGDDCRGAAVVHCLDSEICGLGGRAVAVASSVGECTDSSAVLLLCIGDETVCVGLARVSVVPMAVTLTAPVSRYETK